MDAEEVIYDRLTNRIISNADYNEWYESVYEPELQRLQVLEEERGGTPPQTTLPPPTGQLDPGIQQPIPPRDVSGMGPYGDAPAGYDSLVWQEGLASQLRALSDQQEAIEFPGYPYPEPPTDPEIIVDPFEPPTDPVVIDPDDPTKKPLLTTDVDPGIIIAGGPEESLQDYLNDPAFYEAQYAAHLGIPTAGRSRYQQWLADQWRVPFTEYGLLGQGLLGGLGKATETFRDVSFTDYLSGREGPMSRFQGGGDFLELLTGMAPEEQIAILDLLAGEGQGGQSAFAQTVFQGGLEGQFPQFIAQGMAGQAFGQPSIGAYEISPGALREEDPQPFLNYLRQQLNI